MKSDKLNVIAIDPGKSGGIIVRTMKGTIISKNMPSTPQDVVKFLKCFKSNSICFLEKVHGMPGMGGQAMFTFGFGYGCLVMALLVLEIPTESITPQKWMKELQLGKKGTRTGSEWKNHLKAKAQQLFPGKNMTLKNADAYLILYYGLRTLKNK